MKRLAWMRSGGRTRVPLSSAWAIVVATIATASWSMAGRLVRAQDARGNGEQLKATESASQSDPRWDGVGQDSGDNPIPISMNEAVDGGSASDGAATGSLVETSTRERELQPPENTQTKARVVELPPAASDLPFGSKAIGVVESNQRKPLSTPTRHYGLGADFGLSGPLPDAGLLLALRPIRWIQVQAGGGYNGIAFGVRGGATVINPLAIPLSLTCEGGHYFEGDANKVVRWFRNDVQQFGSLRRFSYDYVNLLGGLEFGGQSFSFYLRGGVTWMRTTIRDFGQSVRDVAQVDLQASDPMVTYRGPTLKLGTQYFF
jgi:hypothetical protein